MGNQRQAYCPTCGEHRLAEKESLDGAIHIIHALITLFSCGLWAVVWLIHALSASGPWRCQRCGADIDEQQKRLQHQQQMRQQQFDQQQPRDRQRDGSVR